MSTTPITNPTQATPAALAQELYNSLAAECLTINTALINFYLQGVATAKSLGAAAPAPPTLYSPPSLAAIMAGSMALTTFAYPAAPSAPSPPAYSLGAQIAPNLWLIQVNLGAGPVVGSQIEINGITYNVVAIGMFNVGAQPAQS